MPGISVVMAVYNGGKYIKEQLESILDQTLPPDEVIIHDDRSTDETVELINSFIAEHGLTLNWKVTVNPENYGWQRNFFEATKEAAGDIIFFSDQDDIWLSDKIEVMANVMKEQKAGCVFGGMIRVDWDGKRLETQGQAKQKAIEKRGSTQENQVEASDTLDNRTTLVPFDRTFNNFVALGCCMCVSRDIIDRYLDIKQDTFGHDMQCVRLALLFSKVYRLDRPVIEYRVHGDNASGADTTILQGSGSLKLRCEEIREDIKWLCRIREAGRDVDAELFEGLIRFQSARYRYLAGRKGLWIGLLRYRPYYSGISMMIGDLAYRHGLNRALGKAYKWANSVSLSGKFHTR